MRLLLSGGQDRWGNTVIEQKCTVSAVIPRSPGKLARRLHLASKRFRRDVETGRRTQGDTRPITSDAAEDRVPSFPIAFAGMTGHSIIEVAPSKPGIWYLIYTGIRDSP